MRIQLGSSIPLAPPRETDRRPVPIDSELRHLKLVPNLRCLQLNVDWVRLTDAGLAHVRGLKELESLDIRFNLRPRAGQKRAVPSIDGLKYIHDLHKLESLNINLCDWSGAQLRDLRDLPRLESLVLMGFEISDTDLEFLQGLKSLEYVSLCCLRVTDKGLVQIKALTNLKSLDLSCPKVTEKGVKELRQACRKPASTTSLGGFVGIQDSTFYYKTALLMAARTTRRGTIPFRYFDQRTASQEPAFPLSDKPASMSKADPRLLYSV